MFGSAVQDLRYAARMLRRAPGFTSVSIATMALAIVATTAIFSVVNGILIKPLPFPDSDRLIALVHQAPGVNQPEMAASPAICFTYREHNQTFESVALWYSNTASMTGGGDPEEGPETPGHARAPAVVISYMFTQRTREIGVRMALGARNGALKRMLLSQVVLVVVVGVALGLAGAALLTRLMESLLFGVGALDVTTYVTVSAILVITAALAAYLPARRVTRIDPMQALRAE
jgi:hypothetical protein